MPPLMTRRRLWPCLALFLTIGCEAGEPMMNASSTLSESELRGLLQTTIDAPQLSGYYHVDTLPERIPLRLVVGPPVPLDLSLTKFGRPVTLVRDPPGTLPAMRITGIAAQSAEATVSFEYPPEGLTGTANLSRQNGDWRLESLTLVER